MRRWLLPLLLLSCKGGGERISHLVPASPSPTGVTFVAPAQAAVLVVGESPAPSAVLSAAADNGTLLVEAPALPVSAPAAAPASTTPPVDPALLEDIGRSLSHDGRALAPSPGDLPVYDLTVQIAPETGSFHAQVHLDYPNRGAAPLAALPFRLFANAGGAQVHMEDVHGQGVTATLHGSPDPTVATVALDPPVPSGAWLHLAYDVSGEAPISMATAESSLASALQSEPARAPDYGLFARFPAGIALADWLPLVAARWPAGSEGGFDEGPLAPVGDSAFADVASFRAAVDLPRAYRLAAPGEVLGQEALPGSRLRTKLALACGRDLALFASKTYEVAERQTGRTTVQVVFQRGHDVQAAEVLTSAERALATLSARLGAYPWNRFTAVEVPLGGGAGGAEFSGLVAIAGMFFTPSAPVGFGLSLSGHFLDELRAFTVTHEVAHQWWSIAVGSHPRLEPDVDEPLTQATAALVLAAGGDAAGVFDRQVAVNYQAMRLLGGEDGPAARATSDYESTPVYAGLVYGKIPMLYEQLARDLGAPRLWDGLRAYADLYRFKVARRGDLARVLVDRGFIVRTRMEALATRWLEEAHGDEDLASRGDPMAAAGELFSGAGGPSAEGSEALENMDPAELAKAAKAALSQAAAGKGDPQTGEAPVIDPAQARQLLQQLDQTMGGADLP